MTIQRSARPQVGNHTLTQNAWDDQSGEGNMESCGTQVFARGESKNYKDPIMFRLLYFVLASAVLTPTFGQHTEAETENIASVFDAASNPNDSLKRVLHEMGTFEGHFRTYLMTTQNSGHTPDYFAWAAGGGLAFYSPVIKNFQVGLSGFIIYNLASSHLGMEDGLANRYELALFDMTDHENRSDLDRLENLYLRYYFSPRQRSFLQLGKFHLQTPLLNLQDSRMRPNLQEGLWLELKDWEKVNLRGGWLWSTSPRSTVSWYGIGESVGIYGTGRAVNGKPASYYGKVKTKRILLGNVELKPSKDINYQLWNYHADHLFNLAMQKIEVKKKTATNTWLAGFQSLWQKSLSDASLPVEDQYISPDEQSYVFSGRIAFSRNRKASEWSMNYTRITAHGRFLFPREWGTETLYTYSNRERNEGAGNVHAVMVGHTRYLDKAHLLYFRSRVGYYRMPPATEAALNKYAMPSYYHATLQANYKFKGFLKGLQTEMLYVFKVAADAGGAYEASVVHNKVDMQHVAVKFDYFF